MKRDVLPSFSPPAHQPALKTATLGADPGMNEHGRACQGTRDVWSVMKNLGTGFV